MDGRRVQRWALVREGTGGDGRGQSAKGRERKMERTASPRGSNGVVHGGLGRVAKEAEVAEVALEAPLVADAPTEEAALDAVGGEKRCQSAGCS